MKKLKYKYPYKARKSPITKELKAKHSAGLTLAPIDTIFKEGLITNDMYKTANYFTYLYSLRFGNQYLKKKVSSLYCFDNAVPFSNSSESWLEKQNCKFNNIANFLQNMNCYNLIVNICIYERSPPFLKKKEICAYIKSIYKAFYNALEELGDFIAQKNLNKLVKQ